MLKDFRTTVVSTYQTFDELAVGIQDDIVTQLMETLDLSEGQAVDIAKSREYYYEASVYYEV